MVFAKAWLAELRHLVGAGLDRKLSPDKPVIGILAFEAAATMARLVCLYNSLSSSEVQQLRWVTMRSQGVAYLNSTDQFFLFCLACAEFMTELDRAAATVARMGLKCTAVIPHGFNGLYNELKACGVSNVELERLGLGSSSKSVDKKIKRMERCVKTTSKLYGELVVMNELEAKEQKQWRQLSGPIPMQKPVSSGEATASPLRLQLIAQSNKVERLKDESLWNKSYDKIVEMMARAVVTVFGRIYTTFSPAFPACYPSIPTKDFLSGPIERRLAAKEVVMLRNSAPIYIAKASIATDTEMDKWGKLLEAPSNSIGASGLALRYANVIVLAEKLHKRRSSDEFDEDEENSMREEMYTMIPMGMRGVLRAKLRECWRTERETTDRSLAEGWKEAVERILVWLGPVAHDTLRWQEERNMDRMQRFDSQPRAMLLQTLHFSDEVKTEAAIVQVLVGLSCMYWYRETSPCS